MTDRQEVEALLAEVHSMAEINKVAVGDIAHPVEGDTLAALCRAWLAVQEAPEGVVDILTGWDDGSGAVEVHYESGRPPGLDIKQRVRIVKEVG